MKYEYEFRSAKNKQDFVEIVSKRYPDVKISTIDRVWYKYREKLKLIRTNIVTNNISTYEEHLKPKEEDHELIKPTQAKMILIDDMVRFKKKITRDYLLKFGFDYYDLEWLAANNMLYESEKGI